MRWSCWKVSHSPLNANIFGPCPHFRFHGTVVHQAIERKSDDHFEKILDLLCGSFALPIDTPDLFQKTPLLLALLLNRCDAVRVLLRHGADARAVADSPFPK